MDTEHWLLWIKYIGCYMYVYGVSIIRTYMFGKRPPQWGWLQFWVIVTQFWVVSWFDSFSYCLIKRIFSLINWEWASLNAVCFASYPHCMAPFVFVEMPVLYLVVLFTLSLCHVCHLGSVSFISNLSGSLFFYLKSVPQQITIYLSFLLKLFLSDGGRLSMALCMHFYPYL